MELSVLSLHNEVPAGKAFGNFDPSIAQISMSLKESLLIFLSPGLLVQVGVELVMPSELADYLPFATLLA
jgi:hypothetical protein